MGSTVYIVCVFSCSISQQGSHTSDTPNLLCSTCLASAVWAAACASSDDKAGVSVHLLTALDTSLLGVHCLCGVPFHPPGVCVEKYLLNVSGCQALLRVCPEVNSAPAHVLVQPSMSHRGSKINPLVPSFLMEVPLWKLMTAIPMA